MFSDLKIKLLAVLLILFLFSIFGAIAFVQLLKPASRANENSQSASVKIIQGMGVKEIADELYSKKVIKSIIVFEIYSFLSDKSKIFKPGNYELDFNQSIPQIVEILTAGPKEISAVITPGMTLKEIDEYLSSLRIVKKGSLANFDISQLKEKYLFLNKAFSLEGFLFPDTYNFFSDSDPQSVVEKILDNFKAKVGQYPEGLIFLNGSGNMNWLILASILEKEVIDSKERQIAGGILEKRIKEGMPLQVDASIIYVRCEGRFVNCPLLSGSDFEIDSRYNTYKYLGLPPSSISNPGLDAISAALHPIKSDYWYYLSDPKTKETIFSKTLEEHNKNRVKYLLN